VQSVGGTMELVSEGRGTTVRFSWPLAQPPP
jgi:hypothetical protein